MALKTHAGGVKNACGRIFNGMRVHFQRHAGAFVTACESIFSRLIGETGTEASAGRIVCAQGRRNKEKGS